MHTLSILATFKNEAIVLREWIEHHISQGFEHFYLINNNSSDNYMDVVSEFIKKGYVTVYHLHGKHQQTLNYNLVYHEIRNATNWLAVCDIDEYWYTPTGRTINYIRKIDQEGTTHLHCKLYNFGSSGYITQPSCIRTSFIKRAAELGTIKSIFKTSKVSTIDIHMNEITNGSVVKLDYTNIRLNHYCIMSKEYFEKVKMVRGDAAGYPNIATCDVKRDWRYFEAHDFNEVEDAALSRIVTDTQPTCSLLNLKTLLKKRQSK